MSTAPEDPPSDERDVSVESESLPQPASDAASHKDRGPWFALLRVAAGARMPEGPLGPETVPPAVLAIPVDLTVDHLVKHARKCNNPRCQHVPTPLQVYRRMRPEAFRGARALIYKTLWTHPHHELVRWVRERILEVHPDLATETSSGALMTGDRLEEVLDDLGIDGPLILAAVLWATEFKGTDAELLFRCVSGVIQPKTIHDAGRDRAPEEDSGSKSLRAKYRNAIRERDRAVQHGKQLTTDLQAKDRALEKAKREFDSTQKHLAQAGKDIENLQRRLRETDLAYREVKRDGEKATAAAATLRRDLRDQQKALSALELGRAEVALHLANERRTVEHLKLQLAAVPKGPDAVQAFLEDSEERLDIARTIAAGGDRARADHDWTLHRRLKSVFLEAYPGYREPPPLKIRAKTPARLVALGGSAEVGRSCYLLELGKNRVLVDCGIKPSASEDLHPPIEQLERVDALVLTHAHTDHIGWVPALVRRFPKIGIYCSEATAALLPVMLDDCYQHYTRKLMVQREQARYISNASPVHEAYDQQDLQAVPSLVINCRFDEAEGLPFGDCSLSFYRAGHILGAASVLLQDSSGRRIFFSGDFASFPQLTIGAAEWPGDLGDVDLMVMESTYAGRDPHRPLDESRRSLVSFVGTTLEQGGSVILASFGLGRAQELLKLIVASQASGELPRVGVHVDGMIKRINPIYRKHAAFDLPIEAFNEVTGEGERQDLAVSAQKHPSIIITTSGMLTGGPVLYYARHLLTDPRHRIVLTGYQDEGAPSRVLKELAVGRRIVTYHDERGEEIKFEAAMPAKEIGLSAHADQPGLLRYAAMLRPKQIALVHGELHGQQILRQHILNIHQKCDVVCGPEELHIT